MALDVSLAEFHRYLTSVKSQSTARKYTEYAGKFIRLMQHNGYKNFADIPPGLLAEFTSVQKSLDLKPSTVRVQVYAVKKYLEWAASRGLAVSSQSKPELPKVELRHRPVLPTNLFSAYFRQADLDLREPMRTATMLLPCCGLRANEMVSLKLDQIHRATVKLRNGKMKTTLFLRIIGKGGKQRNVPLMEEGVEIITGYLAGWRRRQPGPWLFPKVSKNKTKSGRYHVSDRYLRGALQKMRESMGIEFTPHTMRRTYITMLWRKGLDLRTLSEIAGHKQIQTTIDHYIVMEPDDAIIAVHNAGSSLMD